MQVEHGFDAHREGFIAAAGVGDGLAAFEVPGGLAEGRAVGCSFQVAGQDGEGGHPFPEGFIGCIDRIEKIRQGGGRIRFAGEAIRKAAGGSRRGKGTHHSPHPLLRQFRKAGNGILP